MLHFRSHPIRIARTFSMGLPLLLGLALEAQTIKVQLLKYKESKLLRTSAIELTLSPRAGTTYLPQLYEAEIIIHSHPPWSKDFVRKWKLTFYVWTSLYVFLILLVVIICFCRPLILPDGRSGLNGRGVGRESRAVVEVRRKRVVGEGREFSETLRTWQQYRRRRRAELLSSRQELVAATTGSASSYTITKGLESYGGGTKEDVGDSESVCKGG